MSTTHAPYRVWLWVIFFVIVALVCEGCQGQFGVGIKGSGVSKTEQRAVAAFTRIEVGSVVQLEWQAGKESSLVVTAEDNLLPLLTTEVNGETLTIRFEQNVNPTKPVIVKATGPELDGFQGSGASRSELKGVHSDQLTVHLSGVAKCTVGGHAKAATVECSGASAFKGDDFEAGVVTVATTGASSVEAQAKQLQSATTSGASSVAVGQVDTDELQLNLSGSSRCTVSGQVNKLTIDAAGASAVKVGELKAQSVQVHLSGSAHAELDAAQKIAGTASGSSSVRYQGQAVAEVHTSGSASVQRK